MAESSCQQDRKNSKAMKIMTAVLGMLLCAFAKADMFTNVQWPPLGYRGDVSGSIDLDPAKYKIAIIDRVFGGYWSKPYGGQPFISINPDHTFSGPYATGGYDECAEMIYLFAVPIDFDIPLVLGGFSLPQAILDVSPLSYLIVRRPSSVAFNWKGIMWEKRDVTNYVWYPGYNHYSASSSWVDDQDRLHLSAKYVDGAWRCSDIYSRDSFGQGLYQIILDSDPSSLHENLVSDFMRIEDLDDSTYSFRMMYFVAQNQSGVPHWSAGTVMNNAFGRFTPANPQQTTHELLWSKNAISFVSYDSIPSKTEYTYEYNFEFAFGLEGQQWIDTGTIYPLTVPSSISSYTFSDNLVSFWNKFYRTRLLRMHAPPEQRTINNLLVPYSIPTGKEKVHMSLWFYSQPPSSTNVYEIVVKDFKFIPLTDAPSPLNTRLTMKKSTSAADTIDIETSFTK